MIFALSRNDADNSERTVFGRGNHSRVGQAGICSPCLLDTTNEYNKHAAYDPLLLLALSAKLPERCGFCDSCEQTLDSSVRRVCCDTSYGGGALAVFCLSRAVT